MLVWGILAGPGWVYLCESGSQTLDTGAGRRELDRQVSALQRLPSQASSPKWGLTPLKTSSKLVYPLGYRDLLSAAGCRTGRESTCRESGSSHQSRFQQEADGPLEGAPGESLIKGLNL